MKNYITCHEIVVYLVDKAGLSQRAVSRALEKNVSTISRIYNNPFVTCTFELELLKLYAEQKNISDEDQLWLTKKNA